MEDFIFCIERNYQLGLSYYMAGLVYLRFGMIEVGCEALTQARIFGNSDAVELIEECCKK